MTRLFFDFNFILILKGTVDPKLKFHPFLTHLYVSGGSGHILEFHGWMPIEAYGGQTPT